MLKKFYEFLSKECKNSNLDLNENLIQLAIYSLVNNSLISKQNNFKMLLVHSFENNDIFIKFKDNHMKFYKNTINEDLAIKTSYQQNLKEIISNEDKNKILDFMKIFDNTNFEIFFQNLIEYQRKNDLENIFKILKQVNINTYPLEKIFKLSNNVVQLKDYEYTDNSSFRGYVLGNIDEFKTKKFIDDNLGITNKNSFCTFQESFEDDEYLSEEELNQLVFNIKSNNNYFEIYKKYFEEIEIPYLKKEYVFKFEYIIKNVNTIEELIKNNPIIDSTIEKFSKDHPYFFNNQKLNLYIEESNKTEFNALINSYRNKSKDIDETFLQSLNLVFNVRSENNKFIKYNTEFYTPLFLGLSIKNFDNNNKLVDLNDLIFLDMESKLNGKKLIDESMEKFFEYLEINNYSLNLTNLSVSKKFDKLESNKIQNFDYIRNCLIDKINKYSDKIIIVCDRSENYLLDYIHSSDLSTKEILKNLAYINSIKPKTNKEFEDVASYIKKNNNIKNNY